MAERERIGRTFTLTSIEILQMCLPRACRSVQIPARRRYIIELIDGVHYPRNFDFILAIEWDFTAI